MGADAITGADAATGRLTALRDDIFGQTANPWQRQRLGRILDTHLTDSRDSIVRHVAAQQDVYVRDVATNSLETARTQTIADPTLLAHAVYRAGDAARTLHTGQSPEVIEAGVRAAGGSVIAGVIGDRLAQNDPLGVNLFRQYGDRLDPGDRRTLGAAAEMLATTFDAAAWLRERSATLSVPTGDAALDAVNAGSAATGELPPVLSSNGLLLDPDGGIVGTRQRLDEIDERRRALTTLNQQEFAANPARLRANQFAVDTDTARNRAAVTADADALYADLRRHLTTGGPDGGPAVTLPPSIIMSRLTEPQQDAVIAQVTAAIAGRRPATDPQTWYTIHQGLTGDNAAERQRWAYINLVPFMGRLSGEDFAALEKLQTAVRSDDGGAGQTRLQIVNLMANDVLRSVGIDPTPQPDAAPDSNAAQAARFHRRLQDELSVFDSEGREPTAVEVYDIINNLKDAAVNSGWLGVSDPHAFPTEPSDGRESYGRWADGNIVRVAGDDKDKDAKRPRLPGSGNRPSFDEQPPLKQIDPLGTPGVGGGGFRVPRPSPSAGGVVAKPAQPGTPASGESGKAPAGGGDFQSKQEGTTETGTAATTTFIYGPDNKRVPVPPGLSDEEFQLFKYGLKKRLEWDSQTTRRILFNLDMQVDRFLGNFRQGRITKEFPKEFREGTLRELYDSPASAAKNKAMKLLRDGRFERE